MSKVLIVDDDPVTQLYCKKILQNEGFEVDIASDAFEGISKAQSMHFDFMVVDLVMPGPINGVDFIEKMRKMRKNVSIVAYSGFSDVDIKEKVFLAGADSFITKPFKSKELIDALYAKSATKASVSGL